MNTRRLFFLLLSVALLAGSKVLAAGEPVKQLVNCTDNCGFKQLIEMFQTIITFLIYLSPFVAAIGFGIAGFYYITDQGSGKNKEKAHEIFYWTLIGFIVILAAWLIVRTILAGLNVEGQFNLIKPQ